MFVQRMFILCAKFRTDHRRVLARCVCKWKIPKVFGTAIAVSNKIYMFFISLVILITVSLLAYFFAYVFVSRIGSFYLFLRLLICFISMDSKRCTGIGTHFRISFIDFFFHTLDLDNCLSLSLFIFP